ncbi:MAG: glucose dehydrogenase, partial [Mycobacterium sp.]|nr:glucose dehydrogenase [Mycobacterium sp.]
MKLWSGSPNVRAGRADYPIDAAGSDMAPLNFNGVGGGTVLYNAQWPRLLPSDFRVRSDDGVAVDWPLSYEELQPFYEEVDRQFGVSGLGGNPAYPEGEDP